MRATRSSAIFAQGGSLLTIEASRFSGCSGQNVIEVNMSPKDANISQTAIEGHSDVAIKVERGLLRVTDSIISGGSRSSLEANFANVSLLNITIRDS